MSTPDSNARGTLEVGAELSKDYTVEAMWMTDSGGRLGGSVLSTPAMILMMELTALQLAHEKLPEGSATVGFEVCVRHVAPAPEGATCTATVRLTNVIDGRKLYFDVEVREGDRLIGKGTHQRRVIGVTP